MDVTGAASLLGDVVIDDAITVGYGDKLSVGAVSGSGSITVQSGGTIAESGRLAALLPLIRGVAGTLEVDGTLDATGTVLQTGAPFAGIVLNAGTLKGGVLAGVAGTTTAVLAVIDTSTLDGVTLRGPVSITSEPLLPVTDGSTPVGTLVIKDGLSGDSAASDSLTLGNTVLQARDAETLDEARFVLSGESGLQAVGAALTIGAGATVDVTGSASFATQTSGVADGSIVNDGRVMVEANAALTVDSGFADLGQIGVAYGGRLFAAGELTTAAYRLLLDSVTGAGLLGLAAGATLDNTGITIDLAPAAGWPGPPPTAPRSTAAPWSTMAARSPTGFPGPRSR